MRRFTPVMRWWALALVIVLLAALPALVAAAPYAGENAPYAGEGGAAPLPGPYIGLDYSPYRSGQTPWGPYPTRDEIAADMEAIARAGIRRIRIYSSAGQVARDILDGAQANSIKVALGAAISEGQYGEVAEAISLANAYPQTVEFLIIGTLTQAEWSTDKVPLADLIAQIQVAKNQTNVPVTTSEYPGSWIMNQGPLGGAVEVIWVQSFPYWNGACIADALGNTGYYYGQMAILFPNKPVILGETGWPSGGAARECAQPSAGNQASYASGLANWARQNQVVVYIFEFADQAWRGAPGSVETFWGLHTSNRTPKPAWQHYTTEITEMTEKIYMPLVMR